MGAVYIAGSLNMDVVAFAPRHPLPGETLLGRSVHFFPGGKGLNPAVAAARQGATVKMIGRLGNDAFGEGLLAFAQRESIDLSWVERLSGVASGTALIVVADSGENSIVVIPGANAKLDSEAVRRPAFAPGDVLLSLFEVPLPTVESFLDAGRSAGATTILSPSPAVPCGFLTKPDILILNEGELAYYLNERQGALEAEAEARLLKSRPGQVVVVTLGAEGALAVTDQETIRVPGRRVEAVDTTGAGDCFTGTFAARLAQGDDLKSALQAANLAASICVTRAGAAPSMPDAAEVQDSLRKG